MIKRAIFGLLIVTTISALVAFVFSSGTLSFLRWFIGTFVFQFILQYVITLVLDARIGSKIKQFEQQTAELLTKNEQPVACPCPVKNVQLVSVDFSNPVTYKCSQCNKDIKAYTEITSVLATVPIDNKKVLKESLDKLNSEVTKKEKDVYAHSATSDQ